jgi:1-deoxy-D-xylulose-5-phosphate synthase
LEENESDILFLGYGNGVGRAYLTSEILKEKGLHVSLVDLRFAKPLDVETLSLLSKKYKKWYVFSDSAKIGGIGSMLCRLENENHWDVSIKTFEYDDNFITHGNTKLVEESLEILPEQKENRTRL